MPGVIYIICLSGVFVCCLYCLSGRGGILYQRAGPRALADPPGGARTGLEALCSLTEVYFYRVLMESMRLGSLETSSHGLVEGSRRLPPTTRPLPAEVSWLLKSIKITRVFIIFYIILSYFSYVFIFLQKNR